MLTTLSIRDIVLIEKLDLTFSSGLTILTGETGAGKSILLDALGLALGARADAKLVRVGAQKGVVSASFALARDHEVFQHLAEQGIEVERDSELVIRRIQSVDGPSRALINDQPVSLAFLRQLSGMIAEIHGQHADRNLINAANHRDLLDAYGEIEAEVQQLSKYWDDLTNSRQKLEEHRSRLARAETERDYIIHVLEELRALDPQPTEEDKLATARQLMMDSEHYVSALSEIDDIFGQNNTLTARLNAALRKLERRRGTADGKLDHVCTAIDRLLLEMSEAQKEVLQTRAAFSYDETELEKLEERLFALRAAARKHRCQVDQLCDMRARYEQKLTEIDDGGQQNLALAQTVEEKQKIYENKAHSVRKQRTDTAKNLDKAVMVELPPLRLGSAHFVTQIDSSLERAGSHGVDHVEFMIRTNPGTPLAPMSKVASGGELARFMLALKAVIAAKSSAPILIFDEIDTGLGGGVADAIGQRLARLAQNLQVLAITHSPQVAARAGQHLAIFKSAEKNGKRMVTQVEQLDQEERREEIARMLSASEITEEARAQAQRLLASGE